MTQQQLLYWTFERLDAIFPHQELLSQSEVAQFLGNSVTTVRKYIPCTQEGKISKETLARYLIQERQA